MIIHCPRLASFHSEVSNHGLDNHEDRRTPAQNLGWETCQSYRRFFVMDEFSFLPISRFFFLSPPTSTHRPKEQLPARNDMRFRVR